MRKKFTFQHFAKITRAECATDDLIHGLLPANGLAILYGQPKSFKSFIALDIGFAIGRGGEWCGKKVLQGPAVYLAGEGSLGVKRRLLAAQTQCSDPNEIPLYFMDARPNLGEPCEDLTDLIDTIRENLGNERPRLIILDTLARMLGIGDENGAGMQHFIKAAEELAEAFNCLVIAVHHEGKNQQRQMRGHSSLAGAAVSYWKVKRKGKLDAQVIVEASKDTADKLALDVTLQLMALGPRNEDDKEISTLKIDKISLAKSEGQSFDLKPLNKGDRNILSFLKTYLGENGMEADGHSRAPLRDAREAYVAHSDLASQSARKAFDRGQTALVMHDQLKVENIDGIKLYSLPK